VAAHACVVFVRSARNNVTSPRLCALALATFACICASAQDLSLAMGLQAPGDGETEVHITTGHYLGLPHYFVRLRETEGVVHGDEWIFWSTRSGLSESLRSRCSDAVASGHGLSWCHKADSIDPSAFERLYRTLPLERIATLPPQESLRSAPAEVPDRRCVVLDRWFIEVELRTPARWNRVRYSNPDACRPWAECQVMRSVAEGLEGLHGTTHSER